MNAQQCKIQNELMLQELRAKLKCFMEDLKGVSERIRFMREGQASPSGTDWDGMYEHWEAGS